jgi:CRP/FNR family transcriptional regulator, cyclic AMP receptor protein
MKNRKQASFEAQLSAVPLFATLSETQLHAMASRAVLAREPAGTTFTKEGERGDELVVILEGEVQVRHGERVLATLGPGDFVGEMALIDNAARRTATVIAHTNVVVVYVSRHDFEALVENVPEAAAYIAATMKDRSESDGSPPSRP